MLLEATGIQIYVKDRLLIDAPQLVITENERIGIVGRNGSGKTTLIEVLAGIRKPDAGMVKTRAKRELNSAAKTCGIGEERRRVDARSHSGGAH